MKIILIIMALLVSSGAFSQSKKKQIELLQYQLDSISAVNDSLSLEVRKLGYLIDIYQDEMTEIRAYQELMAEDAEQQRMLADRLQKENNQLKVELAEKEEKERKTTKKTNSTNTTNNRSNPFGSGGGIGGGAGSGFGSDSAMGSGTGIGNGPIRTRLNGVQVNDIEITEDATIAYKLTVDEYGNVVAFSLVTGNTTTTDMTLINKIGVAIKKQIKYNKVEGAPLQFQYYTVRVKAT